MHNTYPEKHALAPKTLPAQPPFTPAQLLRWFLLLLPGRTVCQLPALKHQTFYHRLFTPLVTLWYLLFQRLNPDPTLDAALADAQAGGADRINRKLSRQLASASTASYSDARQRLPWPFLAEVLSLQGRQITGWSPTARWHGWLVHLLDGSTVRLRPYGTIPKAFPPHGNQHQKRTYWCLMRVGVSFCGRTGAALDCALGSSRQSEQALGSELMLRAHGRGLFLGDRNFGVFRIVQAARQNHQQVLLRLTQVRARKLLGQPLASGDHPVTWQPTRHDQLLPTGNPAPVSGRLIVVRLQRPGFRSQWLYLFTTLTDPTRYPLAELVKLYGVRWHIELDLRYVKAQMGAAQLEAHSADMARKEWLASLLAYNLVRAAMLAAALQKGLPPLTLSFSAARRRLELWLRDYGRTQNHMMASWQKTLEEISRCRLPHRSQPRPAEPRAQRYVGKTYPPLVGSRAKARKHLQLQALKS
jgi:hypothetical protein